MTFQQGKDNKQKSLQCLHKHKICRQLSIIPENTFIENEIMNESQKSSETSFVFDISTMDDYCLEATALGNLLDIEASNLIYVNCMDKLLSIIPPDYRKSMGYFLLDCAKSCGKPVISKSFLIQSILNAAQCSKYNMLVILKSLFSWSKPAVIPNSVNSGKTRHVFKSPNMTKKSGAESYRRNANSESRKLSTTPSRCLSPSIFNREKPGLFLSKPFTQKASNKIDIKSTIKNSIFQRRLL